MKSIALAYHDVYEHGDHRSTGRTNKYAELYKIGRGEFRAQLRLVQSQIEFRRVRTIGRACRWGSEIPVFLTFDDGGASACRSIAPDLESCGWRGHFFIISSWIGRPGFVDERQIRDLHARGHVIGSHTHSHPERMSHLSPSELIREWRDSVERLEAILGARVRAASVPGGYYSKSVARAAATAGIEVLFTSEPTIRARFQEGCLVVGRYAITNRTRANMPAALAVGRIWPRWAQSLGWASRKAAKATLGNRYLPLRHFLLSYGRSNAEPPSNAG